MGPIAAIDLGTNTTLMLVAEADPAGGVRIVADLAEITRLGRGVDGARRLAPEAIERTLGVLRRYAAIAASHGARCSAVGTSALRDAANREEFLRPAREILGADVHVIAGEREAELTFRGALVGLTPMPTDVTVVDIGGGSTELIVARTGAIVGRVSLDVGSVRLHERHAVGAPVGSVEELAVRRDIRHALASAPLSPTGSLVAIAGTATTLAAMAMGLERYTRAAIHGSRLSRTALRTQTARLLGSTMVERGTMRGLEAGRADVIAVGAVILEEIADWAQAGELIVSDGGVRYGLAAELLAAAVPVVD